MKKYLIQTFLFTLLLVIVLPIFNNTSVSASTDYYPMACNVDEFEVSHIEDDGSLSKVSCHSTLADAKQAMKVKDSYVVRYSKSYSPTKIVAMNSGLVYSYPGRSGHITMNIYQNYKTRTNDSKYKTTYITNHYEMTYVDTLGPEAWDIKENGKGYIKVIENGFEGFTDLEYTDLVPFKYINENIPIYLGGNNTYENEDPFKVVLEQNYYCLEQNGNYKDLVFYYHRGYSSKGNDCLTYSLSIDNATNYLDAGMKMNTKYYSNDGINFYSDSKLTNFVARVYNYYQFLPLRSKTNIPSTVLDNYEIKVNKSAKSIMRNTGSIWIDYQNKYGCNALLTYAMACLESSYGTSDIALAANNLFGWAAIDSDPSNATTYSSVKNDIEQQMGRNLRWFMDYSNRRYFGTCVGNKGAGFNVQYSSDPYWGEKISNIAYAIDKYANNNNGKLSDHNSYTIGFVLDNYNNVFRNDNPSIWDPNIYKTNNTNNVLYTGRYGSNYQKDLTVIVLSEENNRYKIQSTNNVKNNEIITDDGIFEYDWNSSIGFIDVDKVKILNNKTVIQNYTHEALSLVDDVSINDCILTIKGLGLITNYNFTDKNIIKQELNIYRLSDNSLYKTINCDLTETSWYDINDGFSYKYCGFEANIDLNEIDKNNYIFKIKTSLNINNEQTCNESLLCSNEDRLNSFNKVISNNIYRLSTNDVYNYRFELDVTNNFTQIDYSKINKPSTRSSFSSLDSITYDEANNKLIFNGLGMIYYLNYNNLDISHKLYLVNDSQIIEAETSTIKSSYNLQEIYQSKYNMDNIAYKACVDISKLNGSYYLVLEIRNGEYVDYIEITNDFNMDYGTCKNVSFKIDKVRDRTILCAN